MGNNPVSPKKKKTFFKNSRFPVDKKMLSLLARIIERVDSPATFLSIICVNSKVKNYIEKKNPGCCRHLQFNIFRTIPEKSLKFTKFYVYRLKIFIKFQDNFNPRYFKLFPNVEHLEIVLCKALLGEGFEKLKCLKSVSVIKCQHLSDLIFGYLPPTVERLKISGSKLIRGRGLENLKSLKEVKFVDNVHIKDDIFASLTLVESLKIINCKLITNKCIKNMKKLTRASFYKNDNIDDEIFNKLGNVVKMHLELLPKLRGEKIKKCKKLVELKISKCKKFNAQFPHKLEVLKITNLESLTNVGFRRLSKLRELTISENMLITDEIFQVMQSTLKTLEIKNCKEEMIGDRFKKLKNLQILAIENNEKLRDNVFNNLANLRRLTVIKCSLISGKSFLKLKKLKELMIEECAFDQNYYEPLKKMGVKFVTSEAE